MSTASPVPARPAAFHPLLPLGIALVALAVSLFFFSPSLWVLAQPKPGSVYWDRGLQFAIQAAAPFTSHQSDPGLTWRLAPALLARALGLHGHAVFLVPWLGLILLLAQCAHLTLKRTGDRRFATLVTLLVGTTGVTLTVTGWLGLNDAWYASALLAVAFQATGPALALALLAGPWIDERFVLALPLALYVQASLPDRKWKPWPVLALAAASLAFYGTIRIFNLLHLATAATDDYLTQLKLGFLQWLPWTSLGWFMGLRTAWVLVVYAVAGECRGPDLRKAWAPALLAAAPLVVITLLAADTGRAPTMLLPLVLLGAEKIHRARGAAAAHRILTGLLVANLFLPAMHVTYKNGHVINMLPLEIVRWLR